MKKDMKHKKIFIVALLIVFFCILSICLFLLLKDFWQFKDTTTDTQNLVDEIVEENSDTNELQIDWEELKLINSNIVAWIKIENTNINYPILQDNENLFYLRHSFNKKYNSNGSIFTIDESPFDIEETTIYGHNMKNGIIFSELGKFLNQDFLNSHLYFNIYTPSCNYVCKVFSVYSTDVESEEKNIKQLDFSQRIEYYKSKSKYVLEKEKNDKIVKLSTCSYLNNKTRPTNQRYYIVATINNSEEVLHDKKIKN